MNSQTKKVLPLENQRLQVLDAHTIDTGIELGKKVAERHGLNAWVATIVMGILFSISLITNAGYDDANIELINERLTQEIVRPYITQVTELEVTIKDLQTEVIELKSENNALIATNSAYSTTIISLQEQLAALQQE